MSDKYLLILILITLSSCGEIKRDNPHDPMASNFEGPKVTIISPKDGDTIYQANFSGEAYDPQEGNITDGNKFLWISDVDGKLFVGKSYFDMKKLYNITSFSYGKHTITLQVNDEDGNIGYAKVSITYKSY